MDFYLETLLIYLFAFILFVSFSLCILLKLTTKPYPKVVRHNSEKCFTDSVSNSPTLFPSLYDKSNINLSVIVPAYDEETRLPPMLDECIAYLETRTNSNFQYEIIVVSDGSKDKTVQVASKYTKKFTDNRIRVLELKQNRGKGGAVRLGVLSARGSVILFADADGATKFSDLSKLEASLTQLIDCDYTKQPEFAAEKNAIVIGSRAHLEDESIATRSYFRTILMYGFHFLVWLFAVRGLKDTQCGFKLFTRNAARICFDNMHVERWAFDVEVLYIAQRLNIPIAEVAVKWTEIEGSKVTPVWSWIQMGRDLALIWLRYRIGAWKLKEKS